MKKLIFALLFAVVLDCGAIIVTLFSGMDRFLERGRDIVIADCVSLPTNRVSMIDGRKVIEGFPDGLRPVVVNVVRMLKGDKQPGQPTIATIYTMTPGKRYFLYSLGGHAFGTDFLAVPQLSVVEISEEFDLTRLDGQPLKAQVSTLFADRSARLNISSRELEKEKDLLDKALHE